MHPFSLGGSAVRRKRILVRASVDVTLQNAPGRGKVMLRLEEPDQFAADLEPHGYGVQCDVQFIERVEGLVGRGAVQVIA